MADYPAAFGEPLLAARQRDRAEDPRATPRGVLPSPVHRQGGRRAAAALLGTEHAHPGPRGYAAELPAVHLVAEGQGKCHMIVCL